MIWTVSFKFLERTIGFASTLILARLLVPADFGIVAMATSVIAILEYLRVSTSRWQSSSANRRLGRRPYGVDAEHAARTRDALCMLAAAYPLRSFTANQNSLPW